MEEGEGGVLLVGGGAGLVTGKLVIVGGVQVIEGVLIEGVDLAEEYLKLMPIACEARSCRRVRVRATNAGAWGSV